jgi:hypothetical protein
MKQVQTMLKLAMAGACVAVMASGAMAQTATTTTTDATAAAVTPKKPTTSTPRMVDEAQQRSKARSAKNAATGVPEQWGSEEPFTYVPSPGVQ